MEPDLPLGRRVVVRMRRDAGDGGPPLTDVIGMLRTADTEAIVVQNADGTHTIARDRVVAARAIGASRRDVLTVQRVISRGWRPAELVELDGWWLRADRGWTGRANSALPLTAPARPLDGLLAEVTRFYDERGLGVQVQVPLPVRGLLDAELARRCWTVERPTLVLSAPLAELPPSAVSPTPDGYTVELSPTPSRDWLVGYHYRGGALPEHAAALLSRHDRVRFASVTVDGAVVAIARGTVDDGWLGVTAVEVAPEHRRRGLGSALLAELRGWAGSEGATSCCLALDAANTGALALYAGLGFTEHHRYHYRVPPA